MSLGNITVGLSEFSKYSNGKWVSSQHMWGRGRSHVTQPHHCGPKRIFEYSNRNWVLFPTRCSTSVG